MTARQMLQQTRARAQRVATVVRRIIGVPDYDRYVAHLRAHHPEITPPCRRDFEQQRVMERYSKPGARCC
jgi:uncharacterized short protein YbdD (DUF466 family)